VFPKQQIMYSSWVADPRVVRTRQHVLAVVRQLIGEKSGRRLNFSVVAESARVSRRTLYTYWGTIDRLLSDAVTMAHAEPEFDPSGLSEVDKLRLFLRGVTEGIADPVTHTALTTLVGQAVHDTNAVEALDSMVVARLAQFADLICPISEEKYALLVGPLFFAEFMYGRVASEELIEDVISHGVELLGLSSIVPTPVAE
jgi:AcrR family transcriptional regulator